MTAELKANEPSREWADDLDGLLSAEAAAARAGVAPVALQDATDVGEVITLDAKGQLVYPGRQFRHGWPALSPIAACEPVAAAAVSPWTAASWLVSLDGALDGRSGVDYAIVRTMSEHQVRRGG